jgi:hypothetical protein
MRARALTGAVGAAAAIGWLAMAGAARAQDVRITAPAPSAAADDAQKPLTSEESELLGRALLFDPAALISDRPPRTLKLPGGSKSPALDVKNTDRPDGSTSVAVKQPLAIDSVDSNVGADVNLAAQPPSIYQPRGPLPGATTSDKGSAAAWASVGLSNLASVDARVDPSNDQSRIGGKLSHAMPVGKDVLVTLEDGYSVTQSFGGPAMAPPPATVSSLAAPPPPATAPSPGLEQVFGSSKSVKFNVAPTGTSFGAGWTTASNDPVTHHTLSADQKLLGPLHITTSVTDVGQPTENKTIAAGFKLNW